MNKVELFFYNRIEDVVIEGKETKMKFRDSFNVNFVVRTAHLKKGDDEAIVVFLNDIHEEMRMVPIQKNGKTIQESRKIPVQTQLLLEDAEDIKRFNERYDV